MKDDIFGCDREWYRRFYANPTGYGSDGGYRYMHGFPREIPDYMRSDDPEDQKAFLYGYDKAAALFPADGDKK